MANPQKITVKIHTTIAHINRAEWESVFRAPLENYNLFQAIEKSLSSQFTMRYITAYANGQIVCAVSCFIMEYDLATTADGFVKRLIARLKRIFPRFLTVRALICGSPICEGYIGIGRADKEIIAAVLRALEAIAVTEKAFLVAFKDFSGSYDTVLSPLLQCGFYKIQSYPSVELPLNFKTFDEYIGTLSKATRKSLKRKFRALQDLEPVEFEVASDLGSLRDSVHRLYLNTIERSEMRFEVLTEDFWKEIAGALPKNAVFFLWKIKGTLVAFDLCLVGDGLLIDEYVGMDYEVAFKYNLYYGTFRDIVNWCLANGIRRYESGALNYDPKKRLDFTFVPQNIYVRHRNRIGNYLLGALVPLIKPKVEMTK